MFVLLIITIFRLGSQVPAPGVDVANVQTCLALQEGNSLYSLINLFSGGALLQLTIFALGIMPYITASIILQLLVVVIPRLEALKKEGQAGQTKITQYTRYLTLGLALLQATGIVALARSGNLLQGCTRDLLHSDNTATFLTMVQLPRGTDQQCDGSSASNSLRRIAPVLQRILISPRCPRGHPAVHSAAAVRHRRRLARAPPLCPRSPQQQLLD